MTPSDASDIEAQQAAPEDGREARPLIAGPAPRGAGLGDPRARSALAALAGRHGLDTEQLAQLAGLLALVAEDPFAPTTVREPTAAAGIHIADSLAALDLEVVRAARHLIDLGSGAGFPGLPLAVALPQASIKLLESSSRKCRFLEHARQVLGALNADVICRRAEAFSEGLGAHDVALARALGPPAVVLEYAAPLLAVGGTLVDWRGRPDHDTDVDTLAAAAILGLLREEIVRTEPYPSARDHHLHVYLKVRETPDRFPRRPGMARKRPLPG